MCFVVTFTYNSDYPLLQYYNFFDQILTGISRNLTTIIYFFFLEFLKTVVKVTLGRDSQKVLSKKLS